MKTTLTNQEAEQFRAHLRHVAMRNKAIGILFIIADIIAIAGVANYYFLLPIVAHPIQAFFAELGLLAPLMFLNFKLAIKIGFSEDAALATAFAAAAFAAVLAAAFAITAEAEAVLAAMAVMLIFAAAAFAAPLAENKK